MAVPNQSLSEQSKGGGGAWETEEKQTTTSLGYKSKMIRHLMTILYFHKEDAELVNVISRPKSDAFEDRLEKARLSLLW